MMEFNDNPQRLVYAIDLDGTLTNGEPFWKAEPTVNPAMAEAVRACYRAGNIVIVWTARQWQHAPETAGWLIRHSIPFHGLMMGKGGADVYVDDKALPLDRFSGGLNG